MEQPQIRYTKTADGVTIAYYAIGGGPALVYTPPLPITHIELEWKVDDLREAQEAAARTWTFIRYDGRGFGLSDRSTTDFSLEAMVSDLEAVVDAAAPGRFWLMAAEYMAIPALTYAARHPDRAAALVLWLGVSRGTDMPSERMNALIELARTDWDLAKESLSHTFGFDSASANRAALQVANEATTQDSYIALMEAMRGWDATGLLSEIKVPVLVLGRRESRRVPYRDDPRPGGCASERRARDARRSGVSDDDTRCGYSDPRLFREPDCTAAAGAGAGGIRHGSDLVYGHRRFDGADGAVGGYAVS